MSTPDWKPVVCAPRKSGLTRLQLVLLGKGPAARIRPVNAQPWRGAAETGR